MLFFVLQSTGKYVPHAITNPAEASAYAQAMQAGTSVDRNDILSWKQACEIAANIEGPDKYIAVDHGIMEWPRYEVVRAWKVGDRARMIWHGDGFDVGEVLRVHGKDDRYVRVAGRAGPRGGRKPMTFERQGRSGVWKRGHFHLER